ncbi:ribonuclease III [Tahibacter amnicola]|uniref:Ribonuclease 3 n=1 Tax=Tahibacter amnicola TaxID=2976241 RepID=A0ABY6BI37_9GAMM|nr:ribonuclease III [Tahibacter amnicola]UXI69664.1 ribonuclease III [Tahibacter amnicola]
MAAPRFPHVFRDPGLYTQALTHRSAGRPNNERLEFLGDSLVGMLVAEMLFEAHPRADEGELTRLRAQLVSGAALAEVARDLDLGDQLRLGTGELKSGGFRRDSILADAFEALVAAVYLDAGWDACRQCVRTLFAQRVATLRIPEKDAKTRLQELLQSKGKPLPAYTLIASTGEDHAKTFDIECVIESPPLRLAGQGSSRRAAEQMAAAAALVHIKEIFANER